MCIINCDKKEFTNRTHKKGLRGEAELAVRTKERRDKKQPTVVTLVVQRKATTFPEC